MPHIVLLFIILIVIVVGNLAGMEELHARLAGFCRFLHEFLDAQAFVHHLRTAHLDEHRQVDARHDAVRLIGDDETAGSIIRAAAEEVVEEEHAARAVELFDGFLILLDDIVWALARHERHRADILLLAADHLARTNELLCKQTMCTNYDSKHQLFLLVIRRISHNSALI